MKIVIVTQDVGPGNSLRIIGEKLKSLGHNVEMFLGMGKPLPDGNLDKVSVALIGADRLLMSVSSATNRVLEERHAFTEAKRLGVPVAVFSDIYGMYHRPWFTDLMTKTDILFVTDEQEVETARRYVNATTRIIPSGNPYWTEFFKATVSRKEVRSKLGIKPDEKMVLAVGNKELERNVALYTDLVMTGRELEKIHMVLTMHPGADHGKDVYDGILKWASCPVQFAGRETGLSSQEMLTGSDLVVAAGGSSVGIMAACLRKPVIDLVHPIDQLFWEELSGLDFWPPTRFGASQLVKEPVDLELAMRLLLKPDSEVLRRMFRAQEANFSASKFENAVEKIVAGLIG